MISFHEFLENLLYISISIAVSAPMDSVRTSSFSRQSYSAYKYILISQAHVHKLRKSLWQHTVNPFTGPLGTSIEQKSIFVAWTLDLKFSFETESLSSRKPYIAIWILERLLSRNLNQRIAIPGGPCPPLYILN